MVVTAFAKMRPYRANFILEFTSRRPQSICNSLPRTQRRVPRPIVLASLSKTQIRLRQDGAFPSPNHFDPKLSRFGSYQNPSEDVLKLHPHNPLDYVQANRIRLRRNEYHKRRMYAAGFGLAICIFLQAYIVLNFSEDAASARTGDQKRQTRNEGQKRDRMDATPAEQAALQGKEVVVHHKPGTEIIVDEDGTELVETGTSTIPHFPRTIQLPVQTPFSEDASSQTTDTYTLLGVGIRTVSFLSIQVYVVGFYVRNSDMATLQAAFVRHINPIASALIPGEKESLRKQLLEADPSLEVWDKILRDSGVKSAVRIVPVRNTDFQHLRDGWVRGITGRTLEATRAGNKEYEDDRFGEAMKEFKNVFGGKGKAPWGSTLVLTRDSNGRMEVLYEDIKRTKVAGKEVAQLAPHEVLGTVTDERISRQIWLGYLGGRNVSSDGARKSIVDGVVDLVERPVGTVGMQVT